RYAKQQGFGIVKAGGAYKQEKGKTLNERRNCTWKCESGGKPDARIRASSRVLNGVSGKGSKMANRKTKKVGCPVMLHARVTKDGKWQIRNVVLQHQNHEPVPSISKYISMFHRDDLNAVRRRLFQHHDEGVSIPQIHSALAAERNDVENFPVSEHQLRNVVDKVRRLKMMEGDANAMAVAEDEKQADADSARFCHQLVSDFPIERVFQKIYTFAKFLEVQQECLKNLYVSIVGCKVVDEKLLEYTIEDRVWVRDPNTRKDIPTRRKREYEVKYNSNNYEAWCVYKLMESSGIICRHIIVVFEKNDVEEVHDMFILRRWHK
ncbi:Protein FAR1-RELATED SEQUENCE 5, partial [Bienertia sinuspersici]